MEQIYCLDRDCQEDWNEESPHCLCGEPNHTDCKNYQGNNIVSKTNKQEKEQKGDTLTLPWHCSAMGEMDLLWLNNRKHPFIIGVAGQAEAGKTTFLATLYMLLRSGKHIGQYCFAGSYTLLGWEKIASFLSFNSHKKVYFPPHTSSKTTRMPGLLHLALKDEQGQIQDVLFTDAPGEWFKNWSANSDSEDSRGARWIDENADVYMIIADSKAFSTNVGTSRLALTDLAARMRKTLQNRSVSLVWTKSDIKIEERIKTGITAQVQKNLPDVKTFDTAVINLNEETEVLRNNILEVINFLLTDKKRQKNQKPIVKVKEIDDFFFSLR